MNRRLACAVIAVALLAMGAGCTGIFNGISDEQLDRERDYSDLRGSDADVRIDVDDGSLISGGEFRAVYDLDGTAELSLYRSSIYNDEPLAIHSVRYWYPNGTELTGSELDVEQGRSATTVGVPDENGTLAFSGDAGRKTFALPAYVEGSYRVTIPDGHRTSNFLFGDVSPNGYEREIVDDRERLTWDEIAADRSISIRYYLARDIPLFVGLIAGAILIGGVGIVYYYRQVQRLQKRREEHGVDVTDDSDGGPPPGLR